MSSKEGDLEARGHKGDVEGVEEREALEVEVETECTKSQGNAEWETRRAGAMAARLLADVHIHVPDGG